MEMNLIVNIAIVLVAINKPYMDVEERATVSK